MGRAVSNGLLEEVMVGLSDEHGIGKDKERLKVRAGTQDQVRWPPVPHDGTANPQDSGNPLSGEGVMVTFTIHKGHSGCSIESG